MFDNKNQQSNNNGDSKTKKNINLLPEQLRKRPPASAVKSPASADIEYSQVENITSQSKSSSSFMEKLKGFFKSRKKIGSIASRQESDLKVKTTPLQKLYAQKVSHQQNKDVTKPPVLDLKKNTKNNLTNNDKSESALSETKSEVDKKLDNSPPISVPIPPSQKKESVELKQSMSVLDRIDQHLQKGKELMSEKKPNKDEYGVNLIPEEMVSEVDERKIVQTLILVSILAIFLIALVWLIIDLVQLREAKQVDKLKQKIQIAEDDFILKSKDLQSLLAYQNTYDNVELLLDNHLYWTGLLEFIEKNVIDEVYFTSIAADKNGLVEISMIANDYYSLAQQYQIFKNTPEVLRINLEGVALNGDGVDLSMIESMIKQVEQTKNNSSATSTPVGLISTKKLIADSYKQMSVEAVMYLYLDRKNLFYR